MSINFTENSTIASNVMKQSILVIINMKVRRNDSSIYIEIFKLRVHWMMRKYSK